MLASGGEADLFGWRGMDLLDFGTFRIANLVLGINMTIFWVCPEKFDNVEKDERWFAD